MQEPLPLQISENTQKLNSSTTSLHDTYFKNNRWNQNIVLLNSIYWYCVFVFFFKWFNFFSLCCFSCNVHLLNVMNVFWMSKGCISISLSCLSWNVHLLNVMNVLWMSKGCISIALCCLSSNMHPLSVMNVFWMSKGCISISLCCISSNMHLLNVMNVFWMSFEYYV